MFATLLRFHLVISLQDPTRSTVSSNIFHIQFMVIDKSKCKVPKAPTVIRSSPSQSLLKSMSWIQCRWKKFHRSVVESEACKIEMRNLYPAAVHFIVFIVHSMDTLQAETNGDAIYDMWTYKVANDPYLCPGFLKLSSTEFRAIATKVEFHPEFIRFVMKLEEWGIEMKQFMDDLKWFLWDSDYCR